MRRLPDRLLVSVVLSGTICALVALLANWVPYADLDSWTYDFLVNHGGYAQPSSDVVFVDFDDKTFEQVKQYPMPRSIIAQVIQQVGQAQPAVIGLDVLLSEPRDAEEDRVMQDGLTKAGNVILAAQTSAGQIPGCFAHGAVLPAGRQLIAIRVLHRGPAGRARLRLDQYALRRRWLCSRYVD